MSTGFSTSKQEYGDPHFLNYNFMTSASFQWKPIGKIYVQVFFNHFIEYIAKPDRAKMSRMAHIKTWDIFWFVGGHGAVTKISGCWVNTASRQGIKQLGISFASIFLLFSYESS